MGIVQCHSSTPMSHLSLPIRECHPDLLSQGGVSVAEHMPTQPWNPQL
jgi:hypothetical protein